MCTVPGDRFFLAPRLYATIAELSTVDRERRHFLSTQHAQRPAGSRGSWAESNPRAKTEGWLTLLYTRICSALQKNCSPIRLQDSNVGTYGIYAWGVVLSECWKERIFVALESDMYSSGAISEAIQQLLPKL